MGTYLISQYQTIRSRAEEAKPTTPPVERITPVPESSSSSNLTNLSEADSTLEDLLKITPTPSPQATISPTIATSFGPTLSFKITIEGRPKEKQAGKVFVGVLEGDLVTNPKFLLTFLADVPASGEYGNLSIAGLNPGSKYTALLKGRGQIAKASTFIMSPAESKLNGGQALNLVSGDLNEDNIINTADYSIAQKAFNSTPTQSNWNKNADINDDGVVNIFDISVIIKNLGQVGDSGVWVSPIPTATSSGALTEDSNNLPVGSSGGSNNGYWLWIPK
ncbi:hypothetical protein HYS96_04370 [Candidatus Daviesbacteria bacterium]|nr:hypothetical protein [Candidatus Daviesbacteria bacterium]